jgi:hypothetical protein
VVPMLFRTFINHQYSETNVMYFLFNLLRINASTPCFVHYSSGDATQAALGILRACYVCWLHQDWSGTPFLVHYDARSMNELICSTIK